MKKLEEVRRFLRNLRLEAVDSPAAFAGSGLWISMANRGSLMLSHDEIPAYRAATRKLLELYGASSSLSQGVTERALQAAMFAALEGRTHSSTSDTIVEKALEQLDQDLTRPLVSYDCFVQVGGMDPIGLPFKFGQVRFVAFNQYQLGKFLRASRKHHVDADQQHQRLHAIGRLKTTEIWNQPCAVTTVVARDPAAAQEIAQARVRETVNALNYLTLLTPDQLGRLYLPGERNRVSPVTPVLAVTGGLFFSHFTAGPLGLYEVKKLRSASAVRSALRRVHSILCSAERTGVDSRLLAAVQWAGKAAAEPRGEQAFLWYAIALESILLPASDRQDLGYRVRLRVAHLMGTTAAKRRKLMSDVSNLYGIRSAIVHGGAASIAEGDLKLIRVISTVTIRKLLREPAVRRLIGVKELDAWLEARTMS